MIVNAQQLHRELALFADLGTTPPAETRDEEQPVFRLSREGRRLELRFNGGVQGKVIEKSLDDGESREHESYRALLASEKFGDLRKWAGSQKASLEAVLHGMGQPIPVKGILAGRGEQTDMDVEQIDDLLASPEDRSGDANPVQVLLIDGPAGIGKTNFIGRLALSRATQYTISQRPLLLHVQSRGRVLTFLDDLIAFSLQTLRLRVTYDQLPVLVRHGLVTLAIDGFDELGDPNGYDLAWGQINDLVNHVRGDGTLILAGRETFIGRERMVGSIKSLSEARDIINVLSLKLPEKPDAVRWLKQPESGWTDEQLDSVSELFEPGSYMLRPFFLAQLANREVAKIFRNEKLGYPLAFLVDLMIEREAGKFGKAVEKQMNLEARKTFVREFLQEVARDMADQQSDALDETGILWIVDVVTGDEIPSEVRHLLRNRANVMAFLTTDERPGYRRFAHSQLFNHFLGEATIDVLSEGEVPKFVRRNILGADFLAAFSDLAPHLAGSDQESVPRFFDAVHEIVDSYMWTDRGARNMGALLLATLPSVDRPNLRLEDIHVDEALIQGSVPSASIVRATMNQLDVRNADLGELSFVDTFIVTLIVNDSTRAPASFPNPSVIRYEGFGAEPNTVISAPDAIRSWVDGHGRSPCHASEGHEGIFTAEMREHTLAKLLGKVCRVRDYWIRIADDVPPGFGFIKHELWHDLHDLLEVHHLIKHGQPATAGPANDFIHVVNREGILAGLWAEPDDGNIRTFLRALADRIQSDP